MLSSFQILTNYWQSQYTRCSKKTQTILVVNIFRTTNDTKTPFGLYDKETHTVLCTLWIHFNVSSICRMQDIKAVHEFLPCSAQHVCVHPPVCMQLWSENEDPAGLPPWSCRHLWQTPTEEKKSRGVMSGDRGGPPDGWSVLANPLIWKIFFRDTLSLPLCIPVSEATGCICQ